MRESRGKSVSFRFTLEQHARKTTEKRMLAKDNYVSVTTREMQLVAQVRSADQPQQMTLWPSGQGVGLLSRWGLPAWVRIPQVSFCCGHTPSTFRRTRNAGQTHSSAQSTTT